VDGRYAASVSKASALGHTTEVVEQCNHGDPSTSRKSPGRTEYDAITLEQGVTHDGEFERWATKSLNFGPGPDAEISDKDLRKDVILEIYNEAGQLAVAYKLYRCWASEWHAEAEIDGNGNAVLIQHIRSSWRAGSAIRRLQGTTRLLRSYPPGTGDPSSGHRSRHEHRREL
jgi:phage tail-like protein